MKKSFTKVLMTCLTLAAFLAVGTKAYAVNEQDAMSKFFDMTANAGITIAGTSTAPLVNLQFSGLTQAGDPATSTGAYVTIAAGAMTFYQPFATLDTSVGTLGVITYASTLPENSLGALCDYLQGLGKKYKCQLRGGKRDDMPGILATQTATDHVKNLAAPGGATIMQSTSTFVSLGITPSAGRRVVLQQCTVNGQDSATPGNFLYVYGQLKKYGAVASPFARDPYGVAADDTYMVWRSSTPQNADVTVPAAPIFGGWLEFAQDAHVVVRVGLGGTPTAYAGLGVQAAANGNKVTCFWEEK